MQKFYSLEINFYLSFLICLGALLARVAGELFAREFSFIHVREQTANNKPTLVTCSKIYLGTICCYMSLFIKPDVARATIFSQEVFSKF